MLFFSLNEMLMIVWMIEGWFAPSNNLFIRDPANPNLYIFMSDKGKS